MKRFLTFLALCCLMVTGVWAQGVAINSLDGFKDGATIYMQNAKDNSYLVGANSITSTLSEDCYITLEMVSTTDHTCRLKLHSGSYLSYNDDSDNAYEEATQANATVYTITAQGTKWRFTFSHKGGSYQVVGGVSAPIISWSGSDGAVRRDWVVWSFPFKADDYYTIKCKNNNEYAAYNANATADDVNHLARSTSFSSNTLFRIVPNGSYFNIVPAVVPDQYVYAINTDDANSNVGVGTKNANDEDALWQIVGNGDAYNIIPKNGTRGWNCRGSVNSVDVIGQWGSNNTNDNRWYITEAVAPIEAGKTYTMTLNGKNVKYNAGGSNFTLVTDTPEGNDFNFTVGGNPADGYTLYSKGASNYIAHTKDNAYTAGGADDAVASPNETAARYDWYVQGDNVYLKIHGTNNNYLNNRGDKLSTWNDGRSLGTDGSKMTFTLVEDVPVTPDPVTATYTLNPAAGTVEASELATVTVTFTDADVAGTIWFDSTDTDLVPALTHEGADPIWGEIAQNTTGETGVYDITFNTADMEEGEWTLTIPEGAFYILGIGTPNTPIAEMSATYTVGSSASQITDLANLSNDKAYVLICERGQLSTSNGQLAAVAKDREDAYTAEANKFAIIKSNDKYYLWSVAEDGYVRTNKTITDRLSAQEITLDAQEDGTFLLKLAGNGVNMQNNASGVLVDGWVQADGGNKYAIYEVDDFADAEKAIAAIPGWAPTAGKVYTIKAHFTSDDYTDLYLSSDTSAEQLALPMPTTATANQSYWVAEASNNTTRPWKFKSGYGYAKYLDWQNGGLTASGDNFKLLECSNVIFDHHLNVNTGDRNIGTWADASKGFGAVGQGGCWAGTHGHANSNWTTDYTIEEVTGVDVYTVSGDATTGVTGIEGYTYASSIGNGGVVIVPAGTELTSANFTAASDVEVIIDNNAKTIKLLRKIVAGTYYMTIENKDTGRQPFLYNSVQYADEITLQSTQANTNGHIWKLTFDGNGTITDVKNAENGKGIKPKSNNCSSNITSFTYERGANAGYYNLINSTLITGGHDRLNATASGFSNEAGVKAVTTWNGTHNDNEWRFNTVDTEGLEEYNVVVSQPEGCRGYVLYDGKKAGNGGFFLAPADLEQSALTAPELRGYLCEGVTLSDHTISVTYTAATPVQVTYSLYLEGNDTPFETAAEAVTEYVGQAPQHPFTVPEYVDVTYDQGVDENGLIDGTATEIKVITSYNELMPFTPGELTTVDIDVRNHFYFHVEERTMMIDDVETTLWVPCISPKEPTFNDDAAYIWRMEGDWYNGFRFHNDQIALTATGDTDATNCHITFHHKEVMLDEEEQMEGMKGETSLTEKTFKLVSDGGELSDTQSRATLTGDANDANSYFDLVYAKPADRSQGQDAVYQFKIHGTNHWLNFRDYSRTGDNPDSLLCLYNSGYADRASSFTFHDGEVCNEDDQAAVAAMIDAIEKGAIGAIADKECQEYQDLQTLLARIEDTTKGCTRALFNTYTQKLVNSTAEKRQPTSGEAYRIAVRTKKGHNLYLTDGGGYTTDSLQAAVYVLAQKDEDTYFLAGNNNAELTYFQKQGGTESTYAADDCDFTYTAMNSIEADGENINATDAAMYATVSLNYGDNVATMNVADEAAAEWDEATEAYMNDELSSAFVLEPVAYPYTKPKLVAGKGDGHVGVFASVWLPFPMVIPEGIEVYKGTQERTVKDEPYLGLTLVDPDTNSCYAAGGYILYSSTVPAGNIKVLPASAVPTDARETDDAAFVGSTVNPGKTDAGSEWTAFLNSHTDSTPYVLADKNKGMGFYRYTGSSFPKGKAIWLKPAASSDPECVKLGFDDIISAIEALHGNTKGVEIFDLQGRRLDKVQKGQINVINGQKIMFK